MNYDLTRVVVIGQGGSGKTTFARTLADILGVPHIEMDAIKWGPNWTSRDRNTIRQMTRYAVAEDRWIFDGNYKVVRDIVWPQATAIIWLNYPFPLVFRRLLSRCIRRIMTREVLFSGNRESFRLLFLSRDSLLWWVLTNHRRHQREWHALFDCRTALDAPLIEFRHPVLAENFLHKISCLETTITPKKEREHHAIQNASD